MTLLRNISRFQQLQPRRAFASDSSPPLMWKLTHGMFDAETPMTDKYPGIPDPSPITATKPSAPECTTLANGIRVVSQDLGGPVTSLAIFAGAGSRHETPSTSGVSHLLERLAFKGSHERSKFRMVRDMERTGAVFNTTAARETIAYAAEGLREKVPDILPIVAESAVQPAASMAGNDDSLEWDAAVDEIKVQSEIIKTDLEGFEKDGNAVVTEAIHAVAFRGNTLGLPLVPKREKLGMLNPAVIENFISENFTTERLVIAASNYNHGELVELAQGVLGDLQKTSGSEVEAARYTGGGSQISATGPAFVSIGYDAVSWKDKDLVPVCVLHSLLGGGGSFSSGGPGKGMYTRLYSKILNQHGWITSAMAFNHCYSDAGIFGIQASCEDASQLNDLIAVVGMQVGEMRGPMAGGELERAKAMTKSSLIMNLESRTIVCEDLGRQVLSSGTYTGPEELLTKIDAVTEEDVRRVASKMLASTPSVVTYGEEYATQDYAQIEAALKAQTKIAA